MTDMEKAKLLDLAEAYKEHIYGTLLELLPQRSENIDRESLPLHGLSSEEVMSRMYEGVAEAQDAFKAEKILQALEAPHDRDPLPHLRSNSNIPWNIQAVPVRAHAPALNPGAVG